MNDCSDEDREASKNDLEQDESLKPCPFCGSSAKFEYRDWNEETETGDDGTGWVKCENNDCGISIFGHCADDACEQWNKRILNV